jgi:predicted aspartyl protease
VLRRVERIVTRRTLTACLLCGPGRALAAVNQPEFELPFDFLHNQIVLAARVNGQGPYRFVLDSGTRSSTIDLALARRLRLILGPPAEGAGAGRGSVAARPTVLGQVEVGGLVARDLPAAAIDLSEVSRQLARRLDGVLGYSFLNSRILQVDYFRRRIRFYRERPEPVSPARAVFPMRFRANSVLPALEDCAINGTRIPVTIDTGSSLGLILFPPAIKLLGLEALAREGAPVEAAGYRGRARLTQGWVTSAAIERIELGAIEVTYVESGYGEDEPLGVRGGNLGNAVLQDFVLTLDYVNHVVVLETADY